MVHFRSTTESTVIEKSRYFLCWVIYEVIKIIVCLCLLISVNQFSYNFIGRVSYPIFQYFQEIFLKGITQKIMCGFIRLINTFLPFIHNEPKFSLSLWAQASILTEPIIPCIFKKKNVFLLSQTPSPRETAQRDHCVQNFKPDVLGSNLI